MFNFFVNQQLFYALASHDIVPLVKALEATLEIPSTAQWAHFLQSRRARSRPLDRRTAGPCLPEIRASEEHAAVCRGIRRRLGPMLGDREHEEPAYSMLLSLPGSPVIRFGDELRMGDDLDLDQRTAVQTPMQWADERHAGFTAAKKPVHPIVDHGVWSYEHVNVARGAIPARS
jgi:maltose alpha-D-glucosyltransferase / alpha-amylase